MGDEQVGKPQIPAQLDEQIHDLYLGGSVQRADGLVQKDDARPDGQGTGDAYTLQLTAAQFMRIAGDERGRQAHLLQQLTDPGAAVHTLARTAFQGSQGLPDDMFHPETGIGRRCIVLKDDGKAVVQGGSLAGGASGIQIQPVDAHCAPLRFEQAGKHTPQRALAAAGLTDDAQAFPLAEAQGDAAQDLLPFPAEQALLVFLFE